MLQKGPVSEVFNEDNMIGMARFPDGYFDLALVDPPYGIGEDGASNHSRNKSFGSSTFGDKNTRKTVIQATKYIPKEWDRHPPSVDFFQELLRVSKNQIIWVANHFISRIPFDSSCWIVWDKDNSGDFADCELAWTSFDKAVRKFKWRRNGMLQERMGHEKEVRIHPTQKPVALYRWLLDKMGNGEGAIIDTHMGSQSSRIAAYNMGFDYWGLEIDQEYFEAGNKRFKEQTAQQQLFDDPDLCMNGVEY